MQTLNHTRAIASSLIYQVLAQRRSLQNLLPSQISKLSPADSAFVKALVYGVLRDYGNLSALTKLLLKKPPKDLMLNVLISLGLFQIMAMRVPEHAAVSETVAACKLLEMPWASSVVNASLRRFIREQDCLVKQAKFSPLQNHPAWLVTAIKAAWPDRSLQILQKNDLMPPMHLRVNPQKGSRQAYLELLAGAGLPAEANALSEQAITLQEATEVDNLPHFYEGWVSVQDIAAQQAAGLLELKPGLRVLDACAAPGGKTGHILECEPKLNLLAIDQDPTRLARVEQNLARLGLSAALLSADASQSSWWDGQGFDRILLDAPCSASGVIRRHPDIKWLRQPEDIAKLAQQQGCILSNLWQMLAPGGILVYATCSLLPEENDQVISQFLAQTPQAKPIAIEFTRGAKTRHGWQFFPEPAGSDGFYYCKLQKA